MITKRFKLTRTLRYGMQGADVKIMQQWLNKVNKVYVFSRQYSSIPENGIFTMYMTRVFLDEFQKWLGRDNVDDTEDNSYMTYCYDQATHYYLCTYVNLALEALNAQERWAV